MASTKASKGRNAPLEQTTNEESRNVPIGDPYGAGGDMKPGRTGWMKGGKCGWGKE